MVSTTMLLQAIAAVVLATPEWPRPPPQPVSSLVAVPFQPGQAHPCPAPSEPLERGVPWDGVVQLPGAARAVALCLTRASTPAAPVFTRFQGSDEPTARCPSGLTKLDLGLGSAAYLCGTAGNASVAGSTLVGQLGGAAAGVVQNMSACHG